MDDPEPQISLSCRTTPQVHNPEPDRAHLCRIRQVARKGLRSKGFDGIGRLAFVRHEDVRSQSAPLSANRWSYCAATGGSNLSDISFDSHDAEEIKATLGLVPLSGEGGFFRQVWGTAAGSAIYFLVTPDDFSAMHRLAGPEIWHHYSGAPLQMVLLDQDGQVRRPVLGDQLRSDQRPLVVVETGVWMGAYPLGSWSLVGATMAPPFRPDGFELGDRDQLVSSYPAATDDIIRLTRTETS